MAIQIKTLEQLKIMRRAGLLVGQTLELLKQSIRGMTTDALDVIAAAHKTLVEGHQILRCYGNLGFAGTICVSINDEIVHGIPVNRAIENGDIVSIDCGAIIDGWHGMQQFRLALAVSAEIKNLWMSAKNQCGAESP